MWVAALGKVLDRWFRRWMPDPFVLAIGLTFVVLLVGLAVGSAFPQGSSFGDRLILIVTTWRDYLFEPGRAAGKINQGLLYFGFQMCVMLVTGHALATSRPVARVVGAIARVPRSPPQAVALVAEQLPASVTFRQVQSFRPGRPVPTHRMTTP